MSSSSAKLQSQRPIIIRNLFPEVHPLLQGPRYWSGQGWHVDFSSQGTHQRVLSLNNRCLNARRLTYSTIVESSCQGIPVAVKLIHPNPEINNEHFIDAVQKLQVLDHQHLVVIVGSFIEKEQQLGIIMYPIATCDLGELLEELQDESQSEQPSARLSTIYTALRLSPTSINSYLLRLHGCLTSALSFLHHHSLPHQDLHPNHILLHHPTGPTLISFGLPSPPSSTTPDPTTYRYAAPETIARSERPGPASDIFALALCFLELATVVRGRALADWHRVALPRWRRAAGPVAYSHNLQGVQSWIAGLRKGAGGEEEQGGYSEMDLCELMVQENPAKRPSAQQVLFYLECLEGTEDGGAGGCLFHQRCCRPRRVVDAENEELRSVIQDMTDEAQHPPHASPARPRPRSHHRAREPPTPTTRPPPQPPTQPAQQPTTPLPENPTTTSEFECPFAICADTFLTTSPFYDHLSDNHDILLSAAHRFYCPQCPAVGAVSFDELRDHVGREHEAAERKRLLTMSVFNLMTTHMQSTRRHWGIGSSTQKIIALRSK